MGWSWADFEDTPRWVCDVLIEQIQADAAERELEKQRREQEAEMKRRHGRH